MNSTARNIKEEVFDTDVNDAGTYLDHVNYWIKKNGIKEQDIISIKTDSHMTQDLDRFGSSSSKYWTRCIVLYWG